MNIYQKLQKTRVELQEMNLKPSGENTYSNYVYYELSDFLPAINALCNQNGLFTKFNIIDDNHTEKAILSIHNAEEPTEKVTYTSKTAEVEIGKKKDGTGGADPIQNLGGKLTYMKRYVYLNAFEIIEPDIVEAVKKEMTKEVDQEDLTKIENCKTQEELTKLYNELTKKYKMTLIQPLFSSKKEKINQDQDVKVIQKVK